MAKPWSVELQTLRNVLRHGRTIVQKHQGKKNLLQKGHFPSHSKQNQNYQNESYLTQ